MSNSEVVVCENCGEKMLHKRTIYKVPGKAEIILPAGYTIDIAKLKSDPGERIYKCSNCIPENWGE